MKMLTDEPLLWKYGLLATMPNLIAIFCLYLMDNINNSSHPLEIELFILLVHCGSVKSSYLAEKKIRS